MAPNVASIPLFLDTAVRGTGDLPLAQRSSGIRRPAEPECALHRRTLAVPPSIGCKGRRNGDGRETLTGWRRVGPTGRMPQAGTVGTMSRLRRPAGGGWRALLIPCQTSWRLPARPRSRRLLAATPAAHHLQQTPIRRFFLPVHPTVQGARIRARRRAKDAALLLRCSRMAPQRMALELCQGA